MTGFSIPHREYLRRLFDLIVELPDHHWDDPKAQFCDWMRQRPPYNAGHIEELIKLINGRRRHVAR